MDMPRISSPRFRLASVSVVPALLLALAACAAGESSNSAASSPATTAPAAASTARPGTAPVSADNGLAALIRASGVTCSNGSAGTGCTAGDVDSGDFYDVELSPDCGDQGFFAGVAEAKGVETLDAVPSSGSKATATADPSKGNKELSLFGQGQFKGDNEGISIYETGDSTGYILVSNQQANTFMVYPREGAKNNPNEYPLIAEIPFSTIESDGSEVTNVNLGEKFPKGLFVAMSNGKVFQYYDWRIIASYLPK